MTESFALDYDASKGFFLPADRINDGLTLEQLSAIGIHVDGEKNITGFRHCMMPTGWVPASAAESSMQLQWKDSQGRLRAKVFYKPGSQGGTGSLVIWCRYNTVLVTSETQQWAEVFDGNDLIHRSASGPKVVDKELWTARQQPEFLEAEAWLTTEHPDHKNPLAYWN